MKSIRFDHEKNNQIDTLYKFAIPLSQIRPIKLSQIDTISSKASENHDCCVGSRE